jgi:hypothetical protein
MRTKPVTTGEWAANVEYGDATSHLIHAFDRRIYRYRAVLYATAPPVTTIALSKQRSTEP